MPGSWRTCSSRPRTTLTRATPPTGLDGPPWRRTASRCSTWSRATPPPAYRRRIVRCFRRGGRPGTGTWPACTGRRKQTSAPSSRSPPAFSVRRIPTRLTSATTWHAASVNGRGRLAEAEFRSVLGVAREHLGDEDPITINIRINLARTIREGGRSVAAESEFRSIVETARHAPEDDLTTLDIRYELAQTLRQGGSPQAAEDEYRAILATAQAAYGNEHPNTLIIRQGLASALQASGRPEAARAELHQILQLRRSRLGAEHPFTKATQEVLASLGE